VPIGLVSVLMLVVFTIGFPVATFFYIQRALQTQDHVDEVFKNFIRGDYKKNKFWFRHVVWLYLFVLTACTELWDKSFERCAFMGLVLTSFTGVFLWLKPLRHHHRCALLSNRAGGSVDDGPGCGWLFLGVANGVALCMWARDSVRV
jgi:hypothetical protein